MSQAIRWLVTHKAQVGWLLAFVAGGCTAVGLTEVAYVLGLAAAWLHGAGKAPSDTEAKARQ
jgi:hypothetical protein